MGSKDFNIVFEIEKFNGDNSLKLWKLRIESLLVQQGLQLAILGKEYKPENLKQEEWRHIDSKSLSTIRLFLSNEVLYNVSHETTTFGLWTKLTNDYMKKALIKRFYLKKELYSMKMEEGMDFDEHLDRFNGVLRKLEDVDVEIEEEDKVLVLLSSLPDSCECLVDSLCCGRGTLDFESVVDVLRTNYRSKGKFWNFVKFFICCFTH